MIRLMRVAGAQACLCELLQDGEKTENVRRGKERRKESKRKKGGKERGGREWIRKERRGDGGEET